jgi:hypothetical protein
LSNYLAAAAKIHTCFQGNSDKQDTTDQEKECNNCEEEDSEDDLKHHYTTYASILKLEIKQNLHFTYHLYFSNPLLEINSPPPKV